MLTKDTKRRIDSARDILVGQLPLPTDQVELITIALIYKFMDDIDEESRSLGGKPTFFVGALRDLNWRSIISNTLSADARVAKFIQAIEAISTAKHIPELFRSIFKNTFLKFRDGRILKLFLDEINGFTYDHSEELGNAFEYLLSAMGSQGENGQFRTPRHIIDFIVAVVDPQKEDTILDPACGTAGFLISAYNHILKANTSPRVAGSDPHRGDLLTAAQRERLMRNIVGYDITPLMTRLSRVNLYLHHFPSPIIHEYDTLTNDQRWDEKFDCILANPPFMTPKGGVSPHNKFRIPAKRSEVLFADYMVEHLTPNGKAGFIVPEGIIFQSQNAYKHLRKMLIEDYLWAVVSLPSGVFQPYSGVKTSVLLLDRTLARRENEILFVKVGNDGFDLGAQRRPIAQNDLPNALEVLTIWKERRKLAGITPAHVVSRQRILASSDINLSGDRYRAATVRKNGEWPLVRLGDVADYINGMPFKPEDWKTTGRKIIRIQNLTATSSVFNRTDRTDIPAKYVVRRGDLLISWSATIGFYLWNDDDAVLNQHIFKVVPSPRINKHYLFFLGDRIRDLILRDVHGNTMQHITKGRFDNLEIPLPPLEEQERLVAELGGYRQIIESARQILTNYKPTLHTDPKWPMLAIEELTADEPHSLKAGPFGSSLKKESYVPSGYKIYGQEQVIRGDAHYGDYYISEKKYRELGSCRVKAGDVLISLVGTYGKTLIVPHDHVPGIINPRLLKLSLDKRKMMPEFFVVTFAQEFVMDQVHAMSYGGTMGILSLGVLKRLKLPVPPVAEQRRIVSELEAERKLVEANRELAARFEQKLQSRLAEIWGETPAAKPKESIIETVPA